MSGALTTKKARRQARLFSRLPLFLRFFFAWFICFFKRHADESTRIE
jgi:hypothetical protein